MSGKFPRTTRVLPQRRRHPNRRVMARRSRCTTRASALKLLTRPMAQGAPPYVKSTSDSESVRASRRQIRRHPEPLVPLRIGHRSSEPHLCLPEARVVQTSSVHSPSC
jgi:hypothetical protein